MCTLWQSVAYGCQDLWVRIPLHNTALTCRSLELSGGSPIYVVVDSPPEDFRPCNIQMALAETNRVCEVNLQGRHQRYDILLYMEIMKGRSAPELEVFIIKPMPGVFSLPDTLFNGKAPPRLREVQLQWTLIPNSGIFFAPSLTSLELCNCSRVWKDPEEMLDMLSRVPKLETLLFHEWNSSRHDMITTLSEPKREISLTHLSSVSLDGYPRFITLFLLHVHFPSTAELSLEGIQFIDWQADDPSSLMASSLKTLPFGDHSSLHASHFLATHHITPLPWVEWLVLFPNITNVTLCRSALREFLYYYLS